MNDEYSKQKQKLEEFFSPAYLDTLPDPYHVFSKVVEYHAGLSEDEKATFEDAAMDWLDIQSTELTNAERRRLFNGMQVCGDLKLTRAVEKILGIARRFAPLRDPANAYQNDIPTSIVSCSIGMLELIGDLRAIDFLKTEASHCGDENPTRASVAAIGALATFDLDAALDFLPIEVMGDVRYWEQRTWQDKYKKFGVFHITLFDLIGTYGRDIVPKIANRLRGLTSEQKRFALNAFKDMMQRPILEAADGRITQDEEKAALVERFVEALGLTLGEPQK
ncbi:MAG: hypothetical protein HY868_00110 [Chloroflexi bacterium]|nr:hypothetical protein [Chloroflexota bacterium]